jgi:hypothetical protein
MGFMLFFLTLRRSRHIGINNNINSNIFHARNFRSKRETLLMVNTPYNSVRIRHKHYVKVYIIIIICVVDFRKFGIFLNFFSALLFLRLLSAVNTARPLGTSLTKVFKSEERAAGRA